MRQQLSYLDERGGAYEARVDEHPAIGATDFVHLPLATLKLFPRNTSVFNRTVASLFSENRMSGFSPPLRNS